MSNNKLISEFMGWKPNEHHWCLNGDKDLQYHKSWDWLMPVVEKIESLGYELMIAESRCKIHHNTDHSIKEVINIDIVGNKREATYKAIVEFIKKYNDEKK